MAANFIVVRSKVEAAALMSIYSLIDRDGQSRSPLAIWKSSALLSMLVYHPFSISATVSSIGVGFTPFFARSCSSVESSI